MNIQTTITRSDDDTTTTPRRIYVACLAAYNNGIHYGKWINTSTDAHLMQLEITNMLAVSPIPSDEYAIHAHEGYLDGVISEYAGLDTIAEIEALLSEEYADHNVAMMILSDLCGDVNYCRKILMSYIGSYPSLDHFAEEHWEMELAATPDVIRPHVDLESLVNGEVLTGNLRIYNLVVDNEDCYHVFANC